MKQFIQQFLDSVAATDQLAPGEIRVNHNSCDGCGVCAAICPKNVFVLKPLSPDEVAKLSFKGRLKVRFKGTQKSFVAAADQCTYCMLCVKNCHESAIRIGKGGKRKARS